jgi:hypothetical protein
MPKKRIAYHRKREREEWALAAECERPADREIHLELARLHLMFGDKWRSHLTLAREF